MKTVESFDLPTCPNCGDGVQEIDLGIGRYVFFCGAIWVDALDDDMQTMRTPCRPRKTVEELQKILIDLKEGIKKL